MSFDWDRDGIAEVNGVRLGYHESGDPAGAPVLLLHGSTSNRRTWDDFAPRLVAAGHRVVTADLRGHGTSSRTPDYSLRSVRDDVLGLLATLAMRDAVLVGHSVGGYAALAAAQHSPHLVAKLVLEDLAAPPRRPVLLNGVGPGQLLSSLLSLMAGTKDYDRRAMNAYFLQLTRPDTDWWARLTGVRHPTLIFSGGRGSCIPPGRLAEATALMPAARLITLPVGHRVHTLAPDAFADAALSFLADAEVGGQILL